MAMLQINSYDNQFMLPQYEGWGHFPEMNHSEENRGQNCKKKNSFGEGGGDKYYQECQYILYTEVLNTGIYIGKQNQENILLN